MSLFETYLRLGFHHFVNIYSYCHILFILALCAGYSLKQINKVLVLILAFTVGHSITLALGVFRILTIPKDLISFLIPATIFIIALANVIPLKAKNNRFIYIITLLFGLIHGFAFSNYLKAHLGSESNIATPLFAFNIGLEIGQLVVLTAYFLILFLTVQVFKVKHDFWRIFISGIAFGISLLLLLQTGRSFF